MKKEFPVKAVITFVVLVAAYGLPTFRAFPLAFFPFKELPSAVLLDVFKVLDHAHSIERSVAFVQMAESITGKILAFITVSYLPAQK